MTHQIGEADSHFGSSTSQPAQAAALQEEHERLQVLCQRLEAAAAALLRLRDKLQAQVSEWQEPHQERVNGGTGAGDPGSEEDGR